MRQAAVLLAVALLVSTAPTSYAQAQRSTQPTQINIRRFMTPGEFKAAGLDKLTSQELEVLNQWLGKFAQQIYQNAQGGSCSSVIEGQIEGEFQGWSGETIFKLTNGQIWQQSSYAYTYHYAYRPAVTIFPSSGGCKMKVEGVSDSITVKQLK